MPRGRLTNIATRAQVLLERLKAGEVKDFISIFTEIDKTVRDIVLALDVETMGQLTRKELSALLANLKSVNGASLTKATDALFENLAKLAEQQAAFEATTINSLTRKPTIKAATASQAWADSIAQPISATGELLYPFVSKWTTGEVARIGNLVQRAWGEGWTVQQTASAVRGTKALNYNDGVLAMSRRAAEAVARTSIQHVAMTSRMATLSRNSDVVSGYRYVATLDGKTTPECRSLDGHVYKFGEGPIPPIHINCRSTIVAEMPAEFDFLDKGATRSAEFGPVPADQSYYSWLGDQSPDFQDAAIGPTRGQLFRDGGLTADEFARLNLGKNFQPLTLAQMQELEPLAFKKAGLN